VPDQQPVLRSWVGVIAGSLIRSIRPYSGTSCLQKQPQQLAFIPDRQSTVPIWYHQLERRSVGYERFVRPSMNRGHAWDIWSPDQASSS